MRDPVTKTIGDREYEIRPMPVKTSLKVLARLLKMFGEPLGALIDGVSGGDKTASIFDMKAGMLQKQLPADMFSKVAGKLVESLDEVTVIDMVDLLLANVFVKRPSDDGTNKIRFEEDFSGRIGHLIGVLAAAVEVNYADFFDGSSGLGGALARAKAAAPSMSA
jgi:hypothetical protein